MIIILSFSFISHAKNKTDISSSQSWKQCKSILVAMSPKTTMIGKKIYLWGSSLYEYDVKSDYWREIAKTSVSRYAIPIVSLNGKIYVITFVKYKQY